jgi:hypothetical protein
MNQRSSLLQKILDTFSLLFTPRAALTRIKTKPRWLVPFLVLSGLSIVLYVLMHPFLITSTLSHIPSSATMEEKVVVAQTLRAELPMRCFFLPIRLLIGWSSFAFVLLAVGRAFDPPEQLHFIKLFTLEVHAELFNMLAQSASLINLLLVAGSSPNLPSLVPFSAATLVPTKDIVSFSLLNSLNFFTLLYVGALTFGISLQSCFSLTKSLVVALLAWSACAVFNAGALKLLSDTLHLLI